MLVGAHLFLELELYFLARHPTKSLPTFIDQDDVAVDCAAR